MNEREAREAVCEAGRRLYTKNLVAATDGNISVRLGADRFLWTDFSKRASTETTSARA